MAIGDNEEEIPRIAAVPPTTTDSVRSSNSGLASEILHGEMVISSSRLQWLLLTTRNLEHLRTRGTTATTRRRLSLTRSRCPRRSLARTRRGWRRSPGSGTGTPTRRPLPRPPSPWWAWLLCFRRLSVLTTWRLLRVCARSSTRAPNLREN